MQLLSCVAKLLALYTNSTAVTPAYARILCDCSGYWATICFSYVLTTSLSRHVATWLFVDPLGADDVTGVLRNYRWPVLSHSAATARPYSPLGLASLGAPRVSSSGLAVSTAAVDTEVSL